MENSNTTKRGCMSLSSLLVPSTFSTDISLFSTFNATKNKAATMENKREQPINHSNDASLFMSSCKNSTASRKLRNKTASAKYRAKKTSQYREMQNTIKTLVIQNDILQNRLKKYESNDDMSSIHSHQSSTTATSSPTTTNYAFYDNAIMPSNFPPTIKFVFPTFKYNNNSYPTTYTNTATPNPSSLIFQS